jgi:predicted RecA/RadA family phage recombinase
MAKNKALERANRLTIAVPSTVKSGDPVMVGALNGVAETDYNALSGKASVCLEGAYFLAVVGSSQLSPIVGAAIKVGDPIYWDGGSLDSTTNVTTGGTLNANPTDNPVFGHALDALDSAASGTIRVRLRN